MPTAQQGDRAALLVTQLENNIAEKGIERTVASAPQSVSKERETGSVREGGTTGRWPWYLVCEEQCGRSSSHTLYFSTLLFLKRGIISTWLKATCSLSPNEVLNIVTISSISFKRILITERERCMWSHGVARLEQIMILLQCDYHDINTERIADGLELQPWRPFLVCFLWFFLHFRLRGFVLFPCVLLFILSSRFPFLFFSCLFSKVLLQWSIRFVSLSNPRHPTRNSMVRDELFIWLKTILSSSLPLLKHPSHSLHSSLFLFSPHLAPLVFPFPLLFHIVSVGHMTVMASVHFLALAFSDTAIHLWFVTT